MTQPVTTLILVFCVLLVAGCEGQRYKPAAWDAAPRVKDAGISDSDEAHPNAKIPPLPEVTDWMSPGSRKRRARSTARGYRGDAAPYRGDGGAYRGNARPYRGNAATIGGSANSYRGNVGRRYNNPLRPYRGDAGTSADRNYGGWRSSNDRGGRSPTENSRKRNGPYRGY